MNADKFYILFFALLCEAKPSLMPQAILQLVQRNYGERPVLLEIFYNSRKIKILDETLRLLGSVKQLKVTPIDTDKIDLSELNAINCYMYNREFCHQSCMNDAIFLFDTMENYWKIRRKLEFKQMVKAELFNHVVYCEDANEKQLQSMMTRDTYESFLLETNILISLHTMTLFSENQCRVEQLAEINQFSKLESEWKTEKFIRPRIENFHGCELWIDLNPSELGIKMPFVRMDSNDNGTEIAEGAFIDMIDLFSIELNFTYIYGKAVENKNVSTDSAENSTISSPYDFQLGAKLLLDFNSPSSDPICSSLDVFVVPPGQLYTSWEKLLMPFDRQTWMWLGIVFAVAFFVILAIKVSKSTSMYEIIIGTNVTTPSLNMIAIFMGSGQVILPQRNVTRFIFIVFILFCLIMRTAYQGKYFEFLTSDMRRKPIQSLKELKDKNFTVVFNLFQYQQLYHIDLLEG